MKNISIFLSLAVVVLLSQACKKNSVELNDMEYTGTPICATDNFFYVKDLKVNNSSTPAAVNLRLAPYSVSITAKLSEKVSWTVTITGLTSGATKTFHEISDTVGVKWYGNCDGGEPGGDKFFITGETVNISLQPSCKTAVTIPLVISNSADFNSYGSIVADCDAFNFGYAYPASPLPGTRNVDTLMAMANQSPQGGECHKSFGLEGFSGWYIGGYGQAGLDLTTILGSDLTSDNVYINFYAMGNSNTTLNLDIVEEVGASNYHFKKAVPINWTGWKMVSLKLSELYIGDPTNVKSVDLSVGPSSYNAETECYVDFVIFTRDKPFLGPN